MTIEYFHASKFGNGAMVATEFREQMAARGVTVNVHHIRDASPKELPPADLYVFSSPGRMGRPIGGMRRFLKKVALQPGTEYALLTTEAAPQPDKDTGRLPTEEEAAQWQRVRPIMREILQGKGLVELAADTVLVTGLQGRWKRAGRRRSRHSRPGSPSRTASGGGPGERAPPSTRDPTGVGDATMVPVTPSPSVSGVMPTETARVADGRGAHAARLDSLTGLRWWAAFAVFLHHMGSFAPLPVREFLVFGNFGVTFFFVLSGFVLTWSARPGLPVTTFWWRRFARIWPAHAVALLLAVPVFYSLSADPAHWWVKPLDLGVLALSVVLLQGWWRDPAVLFSGNPAAWTLTCEAFFYALHPALLRAFMRLRRRGVLVATAAVVVVAVVLRMGVLAWPDFPLGGLPLPVFRLTEFVIGIGVARAMRLGWRPPLNPLVTYLLTAAALLAAFVFTDKVAARFVNEVVIVLFALMIAAVASRDVDGTSSLLRSRPLVALGEWSYAFYLVHATVVYAALALLGSRPLGWGGLPWYPVLLAACLAAAAVLHLVVEKPVEQRLRVWWDDRRERRAPRSAVVERPVEP